jgi:hypothetical protein
MAKVTRDLSARSYIAAENFEGDFLKYVVSKVDFKTVGSLSPVTTNPADCPAGRVLRENGRKLAPGMNPNVTTYMVGVYDNQSGLNGFIDPNSPVFAVYSDNRPNFLVDNVDPGNGANGGVQNLTDRSAPVLTNGLVSAATTVTAGTGITSTTGQVRAANVITMPVSLNGAPVTINPALGQVFKISANANFDINTPSPNNLPGALLYLIFTNTQGNGINVSFGAGLREAGGLGIGNLETRTVTFVSDGTTFFEISRSNNQAVGVSSN